MGRLQPFVGDKEMGFASQGQQNEAEHVRLTRKDDEHKSEVRRNNGRRRKKMTV